MHQPTAPSGPSAYAPGPAGPRPNNPYAPPKNTGNRNALIVVLVGVVVLVGLVGSCAGLGVSILSSEVCDELADQPVVVEQLGDNLECSMAWGPTTDDSRMDYYHYEVTGSRGQGVAIVHTEPTGPDASEELVDGELVVGGRRYGLGASAELLELPE